MNSDNEILALDISLPGCPTFSLVNAYFPAGVQDISVLNSAISSCRKQIVLAVDFNSHYTSWGFRTDMSGKRLWDQVSQYNLTCINTQTPTFLSSRSRSTIDLTFYSPNLSISTWSILNLGTSSDDLPIYFEILCPVTSVISHSITHINFSTFEK